MFWSAPCSWQRRGTSPSTCTFCGQTAPDRSNNHSAHFHRPALHVQLTSLFVRCAASQALPGVFICQMIPQSTCPSPRPPMFYFSPLFADYKQQHQLPNMSLPNNQENKQETLLPQIMTRPRYQCWCRWCHPLHHPCHSHHPIHPVHAVLAVMLGPS